MRAFRLGCISVSRTPLCLERRCRLTAACPDASPAEFMDIPEITDGVLLPLTIVVGAVGAVAAMIEATPGDDAVSFCFFPPCQSPLHSFGKEGRMIGVWFMMESLIASRCDIGKSTASPSSIRSKWRRVITREKYRRPSSMIAHVIWRHRSGEKRRRFAKMV